MPHSATSLAAHKSIAATELEERVLAVIVSFGTEGCISDEVREKLPTLTYSSVTARFKNLCDSGRIVRDGTRPGGSGRSQYIMKAAEYSTVLPTIVLKKSARAPFLAGMMFAAKVMLRAGNYDDAKKAMLLEINKVVGRASKSP